MPKLIPLKNNQISTQTIAENICMQHDDLIILLSKHLYSIESLTSNVTFKSDTTSRIYAELSILQALLFTSIALNNTNSKVHLLSSALKRKYSA